MDSTVDLASSSPADFDTGAFDLATAAGSLSMTMGGTPTTVDLTAEGTLAWSQYALTAATDVNRKLGETLAIDVTSDITPVRYPTYMQGCSWTNGTPVASSTYAATGIYVQGAGHGFTFTAPAEQTTHKLALYVSADVSTVQIVAHLSDGSAADINRTVVAGDSEDDYRLAFTYRASIPGQSLTVQWQSTLGKTSGSSVDIHAATLF